MAQPQILNLAAGQYAFICVIPSPDVVQHLAKGMVKPFEVTTSSSVAADPPPALGMIGLRDFTFEIPDSLPAGRSTYQVVNDGPEPHEIAIVRLESGRTVADLVQYYAGPRGGRPPHRQMGGMQGLADDGSGFMTLELEPSQYAAICLIREPKTGQQHVQMGMIKGFTVR